MLLDLKDKKVLLVGLGRLGGGLAIAKFLIKNGAQLVITDTRTPEELTRSLDQLKGEKVEFALGEHREEDFKKAEVVVFNPAVYKESPWVKLALKLGKQIENDLTLFLKVLDNRRKFIAITGTRGKTTTTTWIGHLLGSSLVGGNIPDHGLLWVAEQLEENADPVVLETSSFQLEFNETSLPAPKVAVVTNLSADHLNRYGTMEKYAAAKAKIFLNQKPDDFLVLNGDDPNHLLFLKEKPESKVFYVSLNELPAPLSGIYIQGDKMYFKNLDIREITTVPSDFAEHQKYNLMTALLTVYLYQGNLENIIDKIKDLPQVKFREEVIFQKDNLTIVNDSASTSPPGVIAALDKFKKFEDGLLLVAGGTDKNLDFREVAKSIKNQIAPDNLYLLGGSATKKLSEALAGEDYEIEKVKVYESFEEILKSIKERVKSQKKNWAVVFSPGAASFEKFKHEFDRGEKFNEAVKKIF